MVSISFGKQLSYDLAGELFAHLQRLSLRFHRRRSTGDSIRRVLVDSACVSTIVKDAIIPVLTSIITLIVMFGILCKLSLLLAFASLAVVPVMVFAFLRYAEPMNKTSYRQHEVDGRIYETVERTLTSIPVVQAFCREADGDRQFKLATSASLAATIAATDVQLRFKIMVGFATTLGTAAILWIGAYQVQRGELSIGELLIFLSYLASLYTPLQTLAYTSSTVQSAAGSARRVMEVLETAHEVDEKRDAHPLARVRGEIRFEGVTVGYEPGRPVLRDVCLEVRSGETIALVGPTGAGKSTLLSLIPRFADPWQGRVILDNEDLRNLKLASLRQHVSLVLQDAFLFPISLAENIAYGKPGATREQIEAAARDANAHEFIQCLPQGYDTVIGERGATLSGGERQRISIARALLKNSPILILDEPTSALDGRTESLLLSALDRLKAGRTTFVIAHRLSTIRQADRIVVLEDGEIIEIGTHRELIAARGLYSRLHARQFNTLETARTPGVAST
jgi:ATP-binding cassette subfamily B protein/subfamily B ATP-binding cassette protein MsbA